MLNAEQVLVAQSDSVPAVGQRPTTGWLPDEIIVDAHRLSLPEDLPVGHYVLIAGLYNPLTGQRLATLDEAGGSAADAILIAEVTLP